MRSRKNPYVRFLKRQITIRINNHAIEYFKDLSKETGISYQTLIDSYLTDCAQHHRKPVTRSRQSQPLGAVAL